MFPMEANEYYREGLGARTTYELAGERRMLADERRRLQCALTGGDLAGALPETRELLEGQLTMFERRLKAVEAEQAERADRA